MLSQKQMENCALQNEDQHFLDRITFKPGAGDIL